jgi:hypothetical protein
MPMNFTPKVMAHRVAVVPTIRTCEEASVNRCQTNIVFELLCSMMPLMIPFGTVMTVQVATLHAQPDNTVLLRAVATANARKAEVEQYVREIKKGFRPPDPTYAEARLRYFTAYSINNDFLATAVTSFTGGRNGTGLATKASEVQLRTAEFTEYACEHTFGRRRSIGELTHSAITFVDVVSGQKHPVHLDRQIASALLIELQWRSWVDIN